MKYSHYLVNLSLGLIFSWLFLQWRNTGLFWYDNLHVPYLFLLILYQILSLEAYIYLKNKGLFLPDWQLPMIAMNLVWLGVYTLIFAS